MKIEKNDLKFIIVKHVLWLTTSPGNEGESSYFIKNRFSCIFTKVKNEKFHVIFSSVRLLSGHLLGNSFSLG